MDLVAALLSLSRLDSLPRTGWILVGVADPESIAGHIVAVGHLALACAPKVSPTLDLGKILTLVLVHDAPECLTGDLPRSASKALPEGAKASMERSVGSELFAEFPPQIGLAHGEYLGQSSPEARFVKGCDRLQLGLECLRLIRAGQAGLDDFLEGLEQENWSEFPVLRDLWGQIRGDWLENIGRKGHRAL